eukprot:s3767_g6.t1
MLQKPSFDEPGWHSGCPSWRFSLCCSGGMYCIILCIALVSIWVLKVSPSGLDSLVLLFQASQCCLQLQ